MGIAACSARTDPLVALASDAGFIATDSPLPMRAGLASLAVLWLARTWWPLPVAAAPWTDAGVGYVGIGR